MGTLSEDMFLPICIVAVLEGKPLPSKVARRLQRCMHRPGTAAMFCDLETRPNMRQLQNAETIAYKALQRIHHGSKHRPFLIAS